MIYEYALEPLLLNNWKDFRYFIEKFGVAQGRLISRYPKRWKRMVYESLTGCGEVERKRIEDRLQNIDGKMITRQHEWNSQQDWLSNAETEHLRRPFHAIVARSNPNRREYVLEGESVSEEHALWAARRRQPVPRIAQEMAACVALLLRTSQEILFVDPHFGPQHLRFRRPLEAFLAVALEQRDGSLPKKIEIHTGDDLGAGFFQQECQRCLPAIIPAGMKVRLVRWHQKEGGEKFHNRFILTERGGVMFGAGLDDSDSTEGETDDISLLNDEACKFRWVQYTSLTPAFELVDELIIEGKHS